MKLQNAIEILIDSAEREIAGAGCGMRALPSDAEKEMICRAIDRCGLYVHRDWRASHPSGVKGFRHDGE